MKKQEENKEENNVVLNKLYDINNLKKDLDEILNIEDITVSESLIQATLKRAEKEQSKQPKSRNESIPSNDPVQSKEPMQSNQPTRSKRGVPYRYGMIAACACILLVAGIRLITNPLVSKKDSEQNMVTQEESAADTSTGKEDMESAATTDASNAGTSESDGESIVGDTENNSTDSTVSTEEGEVVPSFFDIADEEGTPYTVAVQEIEKIIVYDENGEAINNVTDISDIESLYNAFAKVDGQYHVEVVQNEKQEGQHVRQYAIIAQEDSEWSELHIWITDVDKESYIVTRQLVTSAGESITHRITDVSSNIIQNVIHTGP
ncbi:hypothetical protein SAMN02746066_01331 [Anaerosporobacter mobilis DSM 15930]|jgi:hypothetical protein|uniref:Uncharacterized protein n=1 Tax=Anaerosporobacter mobilis DSM 15930 TaxID=1120996 RepID=A0A1M7HEY9_9FIRM|nr:hypothetical protein [Anaerosporobacter mobilis]SHM27062.1 hypothetical protein SAMN02746066_01331 [Anaerosporobacter mobilis DSM 15930]